VIPVAVVALALVSLMVISLQVTGSISARTQDIGTVHLPNVDALVEADRDLYRALVAERSMIFIPVGSDKFARLRAQYVQNVQQARERVAKFAALTSSADARSKVEEYNTLRSEWEKVSKQAVEARASDTREGRSTAIELSFGEANRLFEAMRGVLDELTEMELRLADAARQESDATVAGGRKSILGAGMVGLVICAALMLVFPALILAPMRRLIAHMQAIAEGDGDLTVRLGQTSHDELGVLAATFNRFLDKLHGIISQVAASANELGMAASRLTGVAEASNRTVSSQLGEIDQVATAMNQMTATIHEVAANAASAAHGAGEADSEARHGQQVVSETIKVINELAAEVQNSTDVIQQLEAESANIGAVLDVIRDIAEQTNLLALNAAIEAARAGEQGRGFAVVADEVRTLASRTQQSTGEIQVIIQSLQVRAAAAAEAMATGRNKAEASVAKAGAAGESLAKITRAVANINDMNTQIASAAEEQSAVSEEINRNTVSIHDLAEASAAAGQQTTSDAAQLESLANDVQARMAQFRV
jgi:methyl-accepting chemotaxis protein